MSKNHPKKKTRTHTIPLVEDPRKPPRPLLKRLDVHNLHQEHVARLRALDVKRPRQVVHAGEVDVLDVVGAVVVFDLAAGPVEALDLDGFAVFDGCC